jgi:1-acyl-sn-glycerol-3-phosphate acyltransferase
MLDEGLAQGIVSMTLASAPDSSGLAPGFNSRARGLRGQIGRHAMSANPAFRAAKPCGWVIRVVQTYLQLILAWRNRLHLDQRDLDVLRNLSPGSGVILASNHADQTDLKVCLVLSRRCGRRFLFMVNREAFNEGFGTAGWWLQRLGAFSVERGGKNEGAKAYAIDLVKRGQEVLVIFPEGEIFYLNDLVQPFKREPWISECRRWSSRREHRPTGRLT